MYEQHFGFTRRPFRSIATGADVFVGPQTAKIMQATRMALGTPDAVIAVMGAPGTGKTTIVNRALDAIEGDKQIIRVARMQLGHDEVLDFLLDEMQAQSVPASTIRKVTLFRRLLAERTAAGVRVFIVLEDAIRIGDDALAEIEALTAADGVGNEGAALVIMGEPDLRERLDGDALTRLKQRVRAYQFVNALAAPELQGYLKHCFRLGGGEFDQLFDAQGAAFLHALTGGIPRTANNLVEAVLNAAAARKLPRVDNRFVASVAEGEFGLTAALPEPVEAPAATTRPEPPPRPEAPPRTEAPTPAAPAPAADCPPDAHVDTVPDVSAAAPAAAPRPRAVPENGAEPAAPVASARVEESAVTPAAATRDDDIPELINDTLPDLEVLAPELTGDNGEESSSANVGTGPAESTPDAGDTSDDELIPTLASTTTNPVLDADAKPAPAIPLQPVAKSVPVANAEPDPVAPQVSVTEPSADPAESVDEVPELQLASETGPTPATTPETAQTTEPAAGAEPAATQRPEPTLEDAVAANEEQEVPAIEPEALPDPTLAELKPDFDVLEEAMADLSGDDDPVVEVQQAVVEEEEVRDPTTPSLPTITLDAAIQENIAEATAALEKHDATIADDTVSEENSEIAAAAPKKPAADAMSDTDIKKIASGIRKARSLEDVDEKMAETLFGAEFSAIAAQVVANPPPSDTSSQPQLDVSADAPPEVPDEEELMQELSLVEDSLASDPKNAAAADGAPPELGAPTTEMEKEFLEVYGEKALEVSLESDKPNPGMDLSASQRLATVRALNAEQVPKAALPPKPAPQSGAKQESPQSIEDQITTSMTATLKALSVRPESANDEDDDEEETPKRGFFSRFRRS